MKKDLIEKLERLHRENRGFQRMVYGEVLDYDLINKLSINELKKIIKKLEAKKWKKSYQKKVFL